MEKKIISRFIHSRLVRWMLVTGCFFLLLLTLFRLVFHLVFSPTGEHNILSAFWMGFRYDARVVCVFLVLVFLAGLLPFFKPFSGSISRKLLLIFTRFFGLLIIIIYTFDFFHFDYLRQRLNASVLSYTEDAAISKNMVWESYPVIKIFIIWILLFTGIFFATRYLYRLCKAEPARRVKRNV